MILFSEELDELRELADRIVVMHRGRVSGVLPGTATRAEIGELMLADTAHDHPADREDAA